MKFLSREIVGFGQIVTNTNTFALCCRMFLDIRSQCLLEMLDDRTSREFNTSDPSCAMPVEWVNECQELLKEPKPAGIGCVLEEE